MKYTFCCFLIMVQYWIVFAQNVGIGTNTPNGGAILHIHSTTKGLLIPNMTTTQRNAIVGPVEGLLIFNLTTSKLNQRQNGAWKYMLNNDYWVGGGSGQMFNIGDNVGINTAGPQERLDVNGNIRTNNSLIINNVSSILQLQNAGVNKGFIQLSGDNLRLGTNSGNPDGDIVFRLDGNDIAEFRKTSLGGAVMQLNTNSSSTGVLQTTNAGNVSLTAVNNNAQVQLGGEVFINNTANRTGIGTSSPTERLHVNGKLKVSGTDMTIEDGRITGTSSGPLYNLLPLAYGRVTFNGNKAGGTSNFTSVSKSGTGEYFVNVTGVTSSSVFMVTSNNGLGISAYYWAPGQLRIISGYNGSNEDGPFHFVIFNP
jgi:hypothetical protein